MKNLTKFLIESRGQAVINRAWNMPYSTENDPLVRARETRAERSNGLKKSRGLQKTLSTLQEIERMLMANKELGDIVKTIEIQAAGTFPKKTTDFITIDFEEDGPDDNVTAVPICVFSAGDFDGWMPSHLEVSNAFDDSLTIKDSVGGGEYEIFFNYYNGKTRCSDYCSIDTGKDSSGKDFDYLGDANEDMVFSPTSMKDIVFVVNCDDKSGDPVKDAQVESFKKALLGMCKGATEQNILIGGGQGIEIPGEELERNKRLIFQAFNASKKNLK